MARFGMAAALGMLGSTAVVFGQVSVLTWHNDNARTGQNLQETSLTAANVNVSSFGKLFGISVDGKVDAQPLYVPLVVIPGKGTHNVLYVATEHDTVFAFDADTGTRFWEKSMLSPGEMPSDDRGCNQVTPEIGVTGTPVIDRTRGPNGAIYLIAMSKDGSGNYFQRLHALDLSSGAELFGGPKLVQPAYPGTGDNTDGTNVIFDAKQYKSRPGLLLLNGIVYTAWGSHCDSRLYTGWVIGYDAGTLAQTTVLNVTPNGSEGGIWMSGAGPAADASGNIYLLDGNGDFDTTLNGSGFPTNGNYGNAFLKLSTSSGLAVTDYFEMDNEVSENGGDVDLGSGGAMVVPDQPDGQGHVFQLAVGAGKDGNLYLVNRAAGMMGKFSSGNNNIYQELAGALPGGIWSAPAYFNGTIYYGPVGHPIYAFQFADAKLGTTAVAQTGNSFGYPGAIPSISANNTSNGIVWATENTNPAVLHAYDATNLQELYNSNQAAASRDHFGAGNKYIAPTIANGKVYVGTTNSVGVFGLLCGGAIAPLSANIAAAGGSGTILLTAGSSCPWTASSNDGFISITGGSAGAGKGSVSYTVLPNAGTSRRGTITAAGQTFTILQAGSSTPVPDDFNGDGHPDVIWQDPATGASQVSFLGGAQGATVIGTARLSGPNTWRIVGVADLNGDGHPDVIWQDPATGMSQVWFLGGAQGTTFTGSAALSGPNAWRIAGVADLNGDGHPDVIWQDPVTGRSQVWFLGGAQGTTFTGVAALSKPNVWRIVAVADFDGDGHPDLIWQDPVTGASQVWFLGGAQGVHLLGTARLSGSNAWRIAGVADLMGDGHPNVIWQDPATGTSQVWYLGGSQGVTFLGSAGLSGSSASRVVE